MLPSVGDSGQSICPPMRRTCHHWLMICLATPSHRTLMKSRWLILIPMARTKSLLQPVTHTHICQNHKSWLALTKCRPKRRPAFFASTWDTARIVAIDPAAHSNALITDSMFCRTMALSATCNDTVFSPSSGSRSRRITDMPVQISLTQRD